jgi:hypothetical protein
MLIELVWNCCENAFTLLSTKSSPATHTSATTSNDASAQMARF